MFKEETICPTCDEHYIVVGNSQSHYCPFCGEPVVIEDERGELEVGEDE